MDFSPHVIRVMTDTRSRSRAGPARTFQQTAMAPPSVTFSGCQKDQVLETAVLFQKSGLMEQHRGESWPPAIGIVLVATSSNPVSEEFGSLGVGHFSG